MPELNTPRLILTPVDRSIRFEDERSIIDELRRIGFINNEINVVDNHHCFDFGENFLHQITFLGCSPTLYSDDPASQDVFISIILHPAIAFAYSSETPPPRCPHCHKTDKNWKQYLKNWQQQADIKETCPNCEQPFHFTEMIWKKNGGYGKLLIQIHGVQEQLAIPNPSLLDTLAAFTDSKWNYFFAENHD